MMRSFLLISVIFLMGCASSYHPIAPDRLIYDVQANENGIGLGYRYEVLTYRGNKKYAKREPKKNIRLVAVKIENNTGKTIKIGENFNLYSGQNQVYPMDPSIIFKELKQGVAIYLLYSLIWLNKTECDESTGACETTMIFPIGVPITIGNMVVSGSANKQFMMELVQYSLLNKEIKNGETAYALVGLPDSGLQPIKVVLKD